MGVDGAGERDPGEPVEIPYLDTSALAKWYFSETSSEDVECYLSSLPCAGISTLTLVEMRCLLARRRRSLEIDRELEIEILGLLWDDVARGDLHVTPVEDEHLRAATTLVGELSDHALRSLDAMHLAIAHASGRRLFATADRVLARAAEACGFEVRTFFSNPS